MTTTQELMKLADAYAEYRDHSEYVHARAALETAIQALQADNERLQSGYLKIRVALGLDLHSTDNLLDVIGALQAEIDALKAADMFWNHDDTEIMYHSIDEFLNDEICNGAPLEVGHTRTIQRAVLLPNIEIRITSIDEEECEAEYEIITDAAKGNV